MIVLDDKCGCETSPCFATGYQYTPIPGAGTVNSVVKLPNGAGHSCKITQTMRRVTTVS